MPCKALINTKQNVLIPPGHPITLLKSNLFNMAAALVKRSIVRAFWILRGKKKRKKKETEKWKIWLTSFVWKLSTSLENATQQLSTDFLSCKQWQSYQWPFKLQYLHPWQITRIDLQTLGKRIWEKITFN